MKTTKRSRPASSWCPRNRSSRRSIRLQRELLALVERRDMAGLERVLGEHQAAFERDATQSARLENAFRAFGKLPRSAEPALDEWVAKLPSSYSARLARASYYISQGLDARGTDFISETAEESLDTHALLFRQGEGRSRGVSQALAEALPRARLPHDRPPAIAEAPRRAKRITRRRQSLRPRAWSCACNA